MIKFWTLAAVVSLASGCASAVDRHQVLQAEIDRPIDCNNAAADIRALVDEKPSRREKLANGIASLWPSTALYNLLSGEYASRVAIANGQFEQKLYNRIMDIESACGQGTLAAVMPDIKPPMSR